MSLLGPVLALASLLPVAEKRGEPLEPFELREVDLAGDVVLRFAVILPDGFDPARPYPVVLALPPGDQRLPLVAAGMSYWEDATSRGWVVISPEAPDGVLFFEGSEDLIPPFLEAVAEGISVENDCFHVAGASNGGRAAFRVALNDPERFCSLTAFPGYPPAVEDRDRLERLRGLPITLLVGRRDEYFLTRMRRTKRALEELKIPSRLRVFPGEGHNIRALRGGGKLFDLLDRIRRKAEKRDKDQRRSATPGPERRDRRPQVTVTSLESLTNSSR